MDLNILLNAPVIGTRRIISGLSKYLVFSTGLSLPFPSLRYSSKAEDN